MRRTKFSATDLNQLQRQLNAWRQSQPQYKRLPEEVWASATILARKHGVSLVARTLGLGFTKLKGQATLPSRNSSKATPAPGFMELQLSDWGSGASSPCRVELSDGAGGKMTLHLPGDSVAVLGLVEAFWRRAK